MNMRKVVTFVVLLALFVGVVGVAAQDDRPEPVTQVGFLVIDLAPLFIGIHNGYFLEEGLDMEFVEIDSGQLGVSAVVTGLADFVDLGVEDVVGLQAQDRDIVMIYSMVDSLTMDLVVRTEVLEEKGVSRESALEDRYAALEGLTFGITRPGAPTELYPKWFLIQAGLDPDTDAEFVAVGGGAALLAALETGQIDAYMLSAPTPIVAEQAGFGQILIMNSAGDVPEFSAFAFESVVVRREWAEENPEFVEGYARAMDRANQFIIDNTEESAEIIQSTYFPDSDLDTVLISLEALLPAVRPDGELSEDGVRNQLQVVDDLGLLEEMPDTSEGVLWTNDFNPDTLPDE
jgi:ABC-type nitrate/sulfonate/bicarbonate transport system substrate-binding protein